MHALTILAFSACGLTNSQFPWHRWRIVIVIPLSTERLQWCYLGRRDTGTIALPRIIGMIDAAKAFAEQETRGRWRGHLLFRGDKRRQGGVPNER